MEEDTNHQSTMSHRQAINKMEIAHFSIRRFRGYIHYYYDITYTTFSIHTNQIRVIFFSQILFE